MIQKLIYRQRGLKIKLNCPRHDVPMVMLGDLGYGYVRPKKKGTMKDIHVTGGDGRLLIARGLFRCPHPGCYLVAPLESSVTIHAEVD